jgi:hypothetical protein
MKKYLILMAWLTATTQTVFSQNFHAQAPLAPVESDGFYRIMFTPEISVYATDGFSNVRIFNENGQETPYLLENDQTSASRTLFYEYKIAEQNQLEDSCTIVILDNNSDQPIHNISLLIRNAEITKELSLSGSDDGKKWYALKDKFFLSNISSNNGTSELKLVDFPLSNYRYYRLWINDKNSAPLNITKAGYYTSSEVVGPIYFTVPSGRLTQADSAKEKTSYVRVKFDTVRLLDKIKVNISGTPFYLRNATLFTEKERINKKGKPEKLLEYLSSFPLNSKNDNILNMPAVRVDNLVMVIENADNPSLKIDKVEVYQLSRHLEVWMEKNKSYSLKFANAALNIPVYDLEFFRDSIPEDVPEIVPGKVEVTIKDEKLASSTFFTSNLFIWSAIVVVVTLLGFMSVKLLRETSAVS